jgi:hypothetical protein
MITANTPWEDALRALTELPEEHRGEHGRENFLRAGRFRRNGRALWDWICETFIADGEQYEVVLGFVDSVVASGAGLTPEQGYVEAMSQFLACRLRSVSTGAIVDAELSPAAVGA